MTIKPKPNTQRRLYEAAKLLQDVMDSEYDRMTLSLITLFTEVRRDIEQISKYLTEEK